MFEILENINLIIYITGPDWSGELLSKTRWAATILGL